MKYSVTGNDSVLQKYHSLANTVLGVRTTCQWGAVSVTLSSIQYMHCTSCYPELFPTDPFLKLCGQHMDSLQM